jgi:mRNA-degrading endonuclease RelE of RelBE toxin-antitoxin system|tara:strand:+ start:1505 stop:1882 length:378 start_codon:yes stop_codon:yes gene_type:complete
MSLKYFQIIFNPTSAAELAGMPKDLQLQILGEFRGLPEEVRVSGFYGRLEHGVKSLHRYRVGNYRVYFECHELGVVVHRIFSRNTLKDFFFRNVNMTQEEDDALAENPDFWEMIDEAALASREET